MENNYYTPTIDEFHVGFEYEKQWRVLPPVIHNNDWEEKVEWRTTTFGASSDVYEFNRIVQICNATHHSVLFDDRGFIRTNIIRVKYLDREDIEAEGWVFQNIAGSDNTDFFLNGKSFWWLAVTPSGEVQISDGNGINFTFYGTIRNRSELRKVMKMIGVI